MVRHGSAKEMILTHGECEGCLSSLGIEVVGDVVDVVC